MLHRTIHASLSILLLLGCDVVAGGGGLPEPEEGSRLLASESVSPIFLSLREDGYVDSLRAEVPFTGDVGAAAAGFVDRHAALFGLDRGAYATSARSPRSAGAMEIVDVDVTLDGVPIEGGVIQVVAMGGAIRYASSGLPHPREVETTPAITAADAMTALAALYATPPAAGAGELVIVDVTALVGGESEEADLAWRFQVTAPMQERVYISAADGAVVLRSPTRYTGQDRTIRDALGSDDWEDTAMNGALIGTEMDGVTTPSMDGAAVYDHLATSYAYFDDRFGYESYDGMCGGLTAVVNFSEDEGSNAAWWDDTLYFTPGMTTQDITQHEMAHGVVEYSGHAPLEYEYRSGALNEHLADAFAAFLDDSADRWNIGEGSTLGVLRSMANPGAYDQPDHRSEFVRTQSGACTTAADCEDGDRCRRGSCLCLREDCDYGHVHTNSGILNHALYLLVQGGTHATDGGREVDGMGVAKAEEIYFTTMSLLRANMGFGTWRNALIHTCLSIVESRMSFGRASTVERRDCGRIYEAFDRIGYGPGDRDLDAIHDDRDICPNDYNPEQDLDNECVTNPLLHCRGFRYERAYELFREGVDIGFSRNHPDALIITARCAISNRDFHTAQGLALEAAGSSSAGGRADAYYVAEFAAERLGRTGAAEGYREQGVEAGATSGMCSGGTEEERMGCADFQRTSTRTGLERLLTEG